MAEAIRAAGEAGNHHFSHFGPEANLFEELAGVFAEYAEHGTGRTRHYVHDEVEAVQYGRLQAPSAPGRSSSPTPTFCSTRACTVPS